MKKVNTIFFKHLTKLLIGLALVCIFASCGARKEGKTLGHFSVQVSAIASSTPTMLWGLEASGDSFSLLLNPGQGEVTREVPNGAWSFYAMTWDGANNLEGNVKCATQVSILEGNPVTIGLNLNSANCADPLFGGTTFNAPDGQFDSLELNACGHLSGVSAIDYACYIHAPGHGRSFTLSLLSYNSKSESDAGVGGIALTSICYSISGNESHVSTGIKLPSGLSNSPFHIVIESYPQNNCGGSPSRNHLPHGTNGDPAKAKLFDDSSNTAELAFVDKGPDRLTRLAYVTGVSPCSSTSSLLDAFSYSTGGITKTYVGLATGASSSAVDLYQISSLTPSGASQVINTNGVAAVDDVKGFTSHNSELYFYAKSSTGSYGRGLYKTDNNTASLVQEINVDDYASFYPNFDLVSANGLLYLGIHTSGDGYEVATYNGSTLTALNINPGVGDSIDSSFGLIKLGTKPIFWATNGTNRNLYTHDGTTSTNLTNFSAGATPSFNTYDMFVYGNVLLFAVDNATNGLELWKTDGTPGGTAILEDANTGSGPGSPTGYKGFNGQVYYCVNNGASVVLKYTDAATVNAVSGSYAATSGQCSILGVMNSELYFMATDASNNNQVYKLNTSGSVTVLTTLTAGLTPVPYSFTVTDSNKALFYMDNGTVGTEPWITDGTVGGTFLLKDINPSAGHSYPSDFVYFNNKFFFSADDGTNGRELWVSDGTTVGTNIVLDLESGAGSSYPKGLLHSANYLYFSATQSAVSSIYRTDGTAAGTVFVGLMCTGGGEMLHKESISGTLQYFQFGAGTGSCGSLWSVESL